MCAFFVNLLWMMLAVLQLSSVMKVGICRKAFLKHLVLHVVESVLVWFWFFLP